MGREWEMAEGRDRESRMGEKSKTYRKQEMENYLLTITCLLMCLIETIYSVLWVEKKRSRNLHYLKQEYMPLLEKRLLKSIEL